MLLFEIVSLLFSLLRAFFRSWRCDVRGALDALPAELAATAKDVSADFQARRDH